MEQIFVTERQKKLLQAIELIELFNEIADNKPYDYYLQGVDTQLPVILEEVLELDAALEKVDDVEILDGGVDSFVTIVGLIQKMEKGGFNFVDALLNVCYNNLSKYTSTEVEALERISEYKKQKENTPVELFKHDREASVWYGMRNSVTGKILKPVDHPKPDLTPYVPDHKNKEE